MTTDPTRAERVVPMNADESRSEADTRHTEERQMLREVHAAVVGTIDKPGLGEKVRELDRRVSRIERVGAWFAGIGTAVIGAAAWAWTQANVHIGNAPPPPPGHP